MPLSEEELRLLEQMERALVAEDPKFASALRGTAKRRDARRRTIVAGVGFVLGVVVLMAGAITATTFVGIIGFVVMLGSAVLALSYWKGHAATAEEPAPPADLTDSRFGLGVIEGGKKSRKRGAPKGGQQSLVQRFEDRWRRRRGNDGI